MNPKLVPYYFKLYSAFSLNLSKLFKCVTFNLKKNFNEIFLFVGLNFFWGGLFDTMQKKTKHLTFQRNFFVKMQQSFSLSLHLKKKDNNGGSESDLPLLSFFLSCSPIIIFFFCLIIKKSFFFNAFHSFFFLESIVKTGGKRVDHTVLPKLTSKIKENGFSKTKNNLLNLKKKKQKKWRIVKKKTVLLYFTR